MGVNEVGWCAVDLHGNLYSSGKPLNYLMKYRIDWPEVANNHIKPHHDASIQLYDENGVALSINHMQGGVFSDNNTLLYLVSGYYEGTYENDGINVFDTATWCRVQTSSVGSGYFRYEFYPGWSRYEEPEGLTYWDLDGGAAPNISGQLHVLMGTA